MKFKKCINGGTSCNFVQTTHKGKVFKCVDCDKEVPTPKSLR